MRTDVSWWWDCNCNTNIDWIYDLFFGLGGKKILHFQILVCVLIQVEFNSNSSRLFQDLLKYFRLSIRWSPKYQAWTPGSEMTVICRGAGGWWNIHRSRRRAKTRRKKLTLFNFSCSTTSKTRGSFRYWPLLLQRQLLDSLTPDTVSHPAPKSQRHWDVSEAAELRRSLWNPDKFSSGLQKVKLNLNITHVQRIFKT